MTNDSADKIKHSKIKKSMDERRSLKAYIRLRALLILGKQYDSKYSNTNVTPTLASGCVKCQKCTYLCVVSLHNGSVEGIATDCGLKGFWRWQLYPMYLSAYSVAPQKPFSAFFGCICGHLWRLFIFTNILLTRIYIFCIYTHDSTSCTTRTKCI